MKKPPQNAKRKAAGVRLSPAQKLVLISAMNNGGMVDQSKELKSYSDCQVLIYFGLLERRKRYAGADLHKLHDERSQLFTDLAAAAKRLNTEAADNLLHEIRVAERSIESSCLFLTLPGKRLLLRGHVLITCGGLQ